MTPLAQCDSCPLASASGEALRPGGLVLTQRALQLVGLGKNSQVLDIACGTGTTALFVAEEYHSSVIGIDVSPKMIAASQSRIQAAGLSQKASFVVGTAEELPFPDSVFDVVTCECAFTLFDGKRVAEEMNRVLKPGGKALVTNIFLREPVIDQGQVLTTLAHCMATAKPLDEQVGFLQQAGFQNVCTEDHSRELKEMGLRIIMKLGGLKKFLATSPETSPAQGARPIKCGYALIAGVKS